MDNKTCLDVQAEIKELQRYGGEGKGVKRNAKLGKSRKHSNHILFGLCDA
jgi:hypothetical protein